MKKQILSIGKALNRAEQKSINGGSLGGTCKALCPGKKPAICSGESCVAKDGFGCYTTGSDGYPDYTFCIFQEAETLF